MSQFSRPPNGHSPYSDNAPIKPQPSDLGIVKWIIILAIGIPVVAAVTLGATCVYLGVMGPDTKVLSGRQVPARFVQQIRDLGVIADDEPIEYFYSDALLNIEEGFYVLTDRKMVVYSQTLEEPAIVVPFGDIESVEADFSDNWFENGTVTMELKDETFVSFPVSSEGGGDRRMVKALRAKFTPKTDEATKDPKGDATTSDDDGP